VSVHSSEACEGVGGIVDDPFKFFENGSLNASRKRLSEAASEIKVETSAADRDEIVRLVLCFEFEGT
jgi:hypothetical protein